MNLNSLGHCICEHQGTAAAGFEPGTPGSESTTLPMSYPGVLYGFNYYIILLLKHKLVIYSNVTYTGFGSLI